jgi:hypothetical protein
LEPQPEFSCNSWTCLKEREAEHLPELQPESFYSRKNYIKWRKHSLSRSQSLVATARAALWGRKQSQQCDLRVLSAIDRELIEVFFELDKELAGRLRGACPELLKHSFY